MKTALSFISILITLVIPVNQGFAINYYVSQETGNDKRSFAEAKNPDTPWKSIDKVNSVFNFLTPGDAILFKRGEAYYGTLHISASGTTISPIKIGAYGSGDKPVITSFVAINGWKSIGNGIYESTSTTNTNNVQVVLIDGEIHEMGRYPNSDVANEGYLTINDIRDNNTIFSEQLNSSPNWKGGEVVIKNNQWIINAYSIEEHSGQEIHYNEKISTYTSQVGYGFFIQNHIKTLDSYGEWYFNPTTKKMNVYFGNKIPSAMKVEVSTLDNLLTKDYREKNIIIENIQFKGSNQDAIKLEGGRNIKITDSKIAFCGTNAILALSVINLSIERNIITNSYNNGMYLRYGNEGAIVKENEVRNTALIAGRTRNDDASGIGIFLSGIHGLVQNNTVINSGFNGIQFNGNYMLVKNNYIDTFCKIKGDCGGIYSFGGGEYKAFKDRIIEGNIVVNGIGSSGGISKKVANYKPMAEGIYLDDNVNNVEVVGNTIGNTGNSGLKMSNVNNITVTNNTIFNSDAAITLGNNKIGEDTRKVRIINNQLFSKTSDQKSYNIKTYKNDIQTMADFDKNHLFRPLGDEFSIFYQYSNNGKTEEALDNLEQWRTKFNKDQNSKSNIVNTRTYTVTKRIGESLYTNSSFDKNINGISCNDCEQKWEANGKTDGGSFKVISLGSSSVKINLGKLYKNKTYLLKLNAYANKSGVIQAYLRYSGSPWEKLSSVNTLKIKTDVNTFEFIMSPFIDANEVSLMVATSETNFTYWMDDLELVEVEASFINPEEEILFEYNPEKSNKTIVLSGNYVNAKLEKFSGEVTIPPYESIVLFRVSK